MSVNLSQLLKDLPVKMIERHLLSLFYMEKEIKCQLIKGSGPVFLGWVVSRSPK